MSKQPYYRVKVCFLSRCFTSGQFPPFSVPFRKCEVRYSSRCGDVGTADRGALRLLSYHTLTPPHTSQRSSLIPPVNSPITSTSAGFSAFGSTA